MNPRTKTLFHFTSSLDTLLRILREGFWPQYCLEDVRWLDDGSTQWRAWPMVSFCDIPISRLHEHTEFYGCYGIGVFREHWESTGLNPVLYVSRDSTVRKFLREVVLDSKDVDDRMRAAAMVMMAYCKPMRGRVYGIEKEKDFYSECEWRFISSAEACSGNFKFFLSEKEFRDQQLLQQANDKRRKDEMLEFRPEDVRYIAVKSRDEVHNVIRFIDTELKHTPEERDLLKTRIIALDELSSDI
ncbi:MAG: hypothetical protein JWO95_2233 [Verrucomicrobiales bacterium]|nr:hypothetical protein [Verrucomicrobiales bacterium]